MSTTIEKIGDESYKIIAVLTELPYYDPNGAMGQLLRQKAIEMPGRLKVALRMEDGAPVGMNVIGEPDNQLFQLEDAPALFGGFQLPEPDGELPLTYEQLLDMLAARQAVADSIAARGSRQLEAPLSVRPFVTVLLRCGAVDSKAWAAHVRSYLEKHPAFGTTSLRDDALRELKLHEEFGGGTGAVFANLERMIDAVCALIKHDIASRRSTSTS